MPRTRGFDEADAVRAAGQLFARFGYEGTSIDDLVTRLGIHRGSLYRTFESKLGLFRRALHADIEERLLPSMRHDDVPDDSPPRSSPDPVTPTAELDLVLVACMELSSTDPLIKAELMRVIPALGGAEPSRAGDVVADGPALVLGRALLDRALLDRALLDPAEFADTSTQDR